MSLMGTGKTVILGANPGVWTTVYTAPAGFTTTDGGWGTYTFVHTIDVGQFTRTGGSRIRLTFDGAATEGFIANAMYVGNGGGGDAFDFGSTPSQVLMGGSGTITVAAGAVDTVTDGIPFVKDATNPLVLSMTFASVSNDNLFRTATGQTGHNSYYKNSVSEASTVDKTGYTTNLTAAYIKKIELLI